jgi:hypothetical protein
MSVDVTVAVMVISSETHMGVIIAIVFVMTISVFPAVISEMVVVSVYIMVLWSMWVDDFVMWLVSWLLIGLLLWLLLLDGLLFSIHVITISVWL